MRSRRVGLKWNMHICQWRGSGLGRILEEWLGRKGRMCGCRVEVNWGGSSGREEEVEENEGWLGGRQRKRKQLVLEAVLTL